MNDDLFHDSYTDDSDPVEVLEPDDEQPEVVDVSGHLPKLFDGEGEPTFALDSVPLLSEGIMLSWGGDGRALPTIRLSQRKGGNLARLGQQRAVEMIHTALTQSLAGNEAVRHFQQARAKADELRQQLASLEMEIAAAQTSIGSREKTANVEDEAELMQLFKGEILQRRRRERQQLLQEAIAGADVVVQSAWGRAMAEAKEAYRAARANTMTRLAVERDAGLKAVEAVLADVLPEAMMALSSIRHFPDAAPGGLSGILDALPAVEAEGGVS